MPRFLLIAVIGVAIFPPCRALAQEAISFRCGDNVLKGNLYLPKTPGPCPAVAFVHGTGETDRNDWMSHPALREHLLRQGIASLCWDKPGVGASTGDWSKQSFQDRAEEAIAAAKFLRGRAGIDPKRVGLWGISQGGWICPLAASQSADVAFIILVSAPVGTIAEQDRYRIEQTMHAANLPEADIKKALALSRRRIEFFRNSTFAEWDAVQKEVSDEPWFKDHVGQVGPKLFSFAQKNVAYDGRPVMKAVKCPVLLIVGGRDQQVPAKADAAVIQEILAKAGNKNVTTKTFPEADHFVYVTGKDRKKTFALGYFSTVSDWVAQQGK